MLGRGRTLPLSSARVAAAPYASAMPGERILVVDDDERLAASLRRSLEYAGYRVGVAHDGPRALTMAGADRPDLVVLDVLLPGLDGYGVCRALRAADGT